MKSGRLLTRPSQTAHFCGLRFKTKGNTLRFSPARGASPPSLGFRCLPLAEGPRRHSAAGLFFLFLGSCPSAQLRGPPSKFGRLSAGAAPASSHLRASAADPAGLKLGVQGMLRRGSGSAGCFSFFKQKALAAGPSLLPGQLPSLHTHAAPPGTRAARCRSRQTMGSWPAG